MSSEISIAEFVRHAARPQRVGLRSWPIVRHRTVGRRAESRRFRSSLWVGGGPILRYVFTVDRQG